MTCDFDFYRKTENEFQSIISPIMTENIEKDGDVFTDFNLLLVQL